MLTSSNGTFCEKLIALTRYTIRTKLSLFLGIPEYELESIHVVVKTCCGPSAVLLTILSR